MMKKIFAFIICALLFSTSSFAATIYFKDGRVVTAEIIQKGVGQVTVREEGYMKQYSMDLIEDIVEYDTETVVDVEPSQFEGISKEKVALIINLLIANGTRAQMEATVRKTIIDAPADRRAEFEELFNIEEIIESLIPVYDKHFTEDELFKLTEFYNSPPVQKMMEVSPAIMQETAQATMMYFHKKLKP